MARGKTIANLAVSITARTRGLQRGLKNASQQVGSFVSGLASIGKTGAIAFGGLAAVTVGTLATGIGLSIRGINDLVKTARKLRIAPNALRALRDAADEAGIPINTMQMAMQRMLRRGQEAAIGTGEAQAAFKELGIDAKAFAKLAPEDQLQELAKRFQNVGDDKRLRLLFKIFDSEGVVMGNLLDLLAKKPFSEFSDQVLRTFRNVDERSGNIENLIDTFSRFGQRVSGFFTQLALAVAPSLDLMLQKLEAVFNRPEVFQAMQAMIKFVGDGLIAMIEWFSTLVTIPKPWEDQNSAMATFLGFLRAMPQNLADARKWLNDTWKDLRDFGTDVRKFYDEQIIPLFEKLNTMLREFFAEKGVEFSLVGALELIVVLARDIWESFQGWLDLVDGVAGHVTLIRNKIEEIKDFVDNKLKLDEAFGSPLKFVQDLASSGVGTAIENFGNTWADILLTRLQTAGDFIDDAFGGTGTGKAMKDFAQETGEALLPTLKQIRDNIGRPLAVEIIR